ncbi:PREDICTED: uncharacterized protein LOC109159383 [Ipomoea nil]|uniref:uncharacterized protein LOC109159383 n=1 Tax=Ipomoea nil TaxID=35883 RepID=UPI000900B81A|nr:PREDICTED: uncharacterized protein LOC109159383 [Ipomoea nil]
MLSPKHSIASMLKSVVISSLIVFLFYSFLSTHPYCQSYKIFHKRLPENAAADHLLETSPTNITHLVFGIAGSSNTWGNKRWYIESWWKPNTTRGYLFLDTPPLRHLPWPPTSPPFRISDDNSKYLQPNNRRRTPSAAIRMVRVIQETFRAAENGGGARWYVMAEDDTVLFVENLVGVLSRYDHRKMFYIGMNSECIMRNYDTSFGVAFRGGGYALSYPLAKAVAENMDACIKRYPFLFESDHILQSCIADLGVSLTQEKGFHQIDLTQDISGLLSSHPHSPALSLHHLDAVAPIFPSMNRQEALKHLMKVAEVDQPRLLQQSVCYLKKSNWSFAVSWGYSVQIYEQFIPPSVLQKPLETFSECRRGARPPYMLNARRLSKDSCEAPHVIFFDSVEESVFDHVVTTYSKRSPRGLPPCANNSADGIAKIRVLSPMKKLQLVGSRRECCDIVEIVGMDTMGIMLRSCMKNEIVG